MLLLYQLAGELVSRIFGLPVPGPVIGMVLLFLTLLAKGRISPEMHVNSSILLRHLGLLFVPAAAGVMLHLDRVGKEWLPIAVALTISTFAGMAVTAGVIVVMTRKRPPIERNTP